MLGKHLQFTDSHHHIAIGSYIREHILVADAGVHATTVAENEHRHLFFHNHRTIDHKVRQRLFTYCHSLLRTASTIFYHFHLFERNARVFILQVTGKKSIHRRASELELLVESHAMLSMHLHIIYRSPCPLHLYHPVLRQIRTHDRVFATLQYEERRLTLTYITDRPPLRMISPVSSTAYLRRRCTSRSTGHRTVVLLPWILIIREGLALCSHASHQ